MLQRADSREHESREEETKAEESWTRRKADKLDIALAVRDADYARPENDF